MGYHEDVQNALAQALVAGLPSVVPVLNGLSITQEQAERYASFVLIVREAIEFDPHEPVNPNPTTTQQPERWTWSLDVKGGGGSALAADAGAQVDLLLETIRTTLGAQRLTSDCGPLHLETEDYVGDSGTGVVYRQVWWHERF
jgi:hypothetical protein